MANIGVFTNPKNELYVGPCEPADTDVKLEPTEVLLRIRATGICGSDVHFWKEGRVGDTMVVRDEHILGHESSADVIKVGSAVKDLAAGDRVAVEPGEQCLVCDQCLHGHYNGCPEVAFKSTPPFQGLLRRFVVHPSRLCHKIGESISYEEGALLEPISVGLAGISQAELQLGDPVLVCGAGPIGIVSAILARAAGAAPLVITDINQGRLDMAAKLVPNVRTVKTDPDEDPKVTGNKIVAAANGKKLRVALECTGFEQSIAASIYALEFRGICEIIGVGKDSISLPFMHASVNEITIRGLFRYANTWPRAIRLLEDKLIDVKGLVTHRFSLENGVEAFETASNPASNSIKVVIFNDEA